MIWFGFPLWFVWWSVKLELMPRPTAEVIDLAAEREKRRRAA